MNQATVSSEVAKRFRAPRCAGTLESAQGWGEAGGPSTGTWTRIQLRLGDGGTIAEARFQCFGCPSAVAAASWLCERVTGGSITAARELRGLDIAEALGLAAEKLSVALVAEDALGAALKNATSTER